MPEILTESFCERCGTRYTFEAAAPKGKRLGKLKTLSKGFVNFVSNDETSLDEAFAEARSEEQRELTNQQLDAFHQTFQFCMSCRQYTCANCWNEVESRCLSCSPMLGGDSMNGDVAAFDPLARIGFGRPATEAPAANGNGHAHDEPAAAEPVDEPSPLDRLLAPSAWPASDLPVVEEPSAPAAPEPAPMSADLVGPADAPASVVETPTDAAEPVVQAVPAAEPVVQAVQAVSAVEPVAEPAAPTEAGQEAIDDDVVQAVVAAELARHAADAEAGRQAEARRQAEAAAEAERQRQEELEAEAERERAAELLAETERRQLAERAAEEERARQAEADRQRQAALAAAAALAVEQERERQAAEAASEADRQRHAQLAAAAERDRQAGLSAEAERERQAAEAAAALPVSDASAPDSGREDADLAAAAAAQTSELLSRFRPTQETPGAGDSQPPVTAEPPTAAPMPPVTAPEPPAVEPSPIAARADRVETPTWQIVAPDGGPEPASRPSETPSPVGPPIFQAVPPTNGVAGPTNGAPAPTNGTPAAPPPAAGARDWPSPATTPPPQWPMPAAGAAPQWPTRPIGGPTTDLWAASSQDVLERPGPAGVQSCVSCGLPLSASARFCRRCGTSQH